MPPLPLQTSEYSPELREEVLEAALAVLGQSPQGVLLPRLDREEGSDELPSGAPRLLGVSGKSRSGKDTMARHLTRKYAGVKRINFSDPILAEVNDWLLPTGHIIVESNKSEPHYRALLQSWGMARRAEDSEYWTRQLKERIEELWGEGYALVIVCGLRTESDLQLIESMGGRHWRVQRAENPYQQEHLVEQGLDDLHPERMEVLRSREGDLQDLYRQAEELLSSSE